MSNESSQFQAQDAFVYVDIYRKSILKSASILTDSIERLEKQYWDESQSDSKLVAELRAMQDALKYVTKGEEPGLVTLGDINVERESNPSNEELSDCRASVESLMAQREQLEQRIRQQRDVDSELQGYVVYARQQLQVYRRRLIQSNSTFVVVVTAMFLVIVVQLYLLWQG